MKASVYTRPKKPLFKEVIRRTINQTKPELPLDKKPIYVDKSTECHVTPSDEARYMSDELELFNGASLCEPSAGTGNLINAIYETGLDINITAIERNTSLCEYLKNRWEGEQKINPIDSCFLEYAETTCKTLFDRIIVNPPFRKTSKHIDAALSLLADEGILVALVPINYNHQDAHTLKILEKNTFSTTSVVCKIIKIYKY